MGPYLVYFLCDVSKLSVTKIIFLLQSAIMTSACYIENTQYIYQWGPILWSA